MNDWRHKPERPLITPVFACSLPYWATSAAAYLASLDLSVRNCLSSSAVCAVLCFACIGFFSSTYVGNGSLLKGQEEEQGYPVSFANPSMPGIRFPKRLIAGLLASAFAGAALAFGYAAYVHACVGNVSDGGSEWMTATLLEDCTDGAFASQALCEVKANEETTLRANVSFDAGSMYMCGQQLEVLGSLTPCRESSMGFCWQEGTLLTCQSRDVRVAERHGLMGKLVSFRAAALEAIGSEDDAHAVVQALSCGYRAALSKTESYAAFQATGLAHMVAVSGAHLVIVTALLSGLLKALRVPRKLSIALLVALMSLYTILAGMPLSCIRAAVMSSIGILSLLGKRRPSSLNALGITVFLVVASEPHAAVSASFALSALATAGIVLFAPLFEQVIEGLGRRLPSFLCQSFSLSVSSGMVAQWYACALFKMLPLIGPLSNIVCAPLFPACCTMGLIAALFGACGAPFAWPIIQVAVLCARCLVAIVAALSHIPFSAIPVSIDPVVALSSAALCGSALWVAWDEAMSWRFWGAGIAVVFAFSLATALAPRTDTITMLDVGQGDAFLIESGGKNLLIDTGNQDRKLLDQLARCHVMRIDWVVITHADDDHCGSLDALEKAVDVDTVALAEGVLSCDDEKCVSLVAQSRKTGRNVVGLRSGDVINLGSFAGSVLWPQELTDAGGNADSIVIKLEYRPIAGEDAVLSALFTGDAEEGQLDSIVSQDLVGDVDILKVGHHGSGNALNGLLAKHLKPEIALIGVGEGNRYGHPAIETLDVLERVGCAVFRTDLDGGMRFELTGKSVVGHKL